MSLFERLSAGEVHLYVTSDAQIDDTRLMANYERLLSADERQRHARFHFARDRRQFIITRALMRCVLSLYQPDVRPESWRFGYNAYGKPHILNGAGEKLCFNLSHTQGRAVLAVAAGRRVGVDIEWCGKDVEMLELAEQFFSPGEAAMLRRASDTQRRNLFFQLWTLKEAYLKGLGTGLSVPLGSFSFAFTGSELSQIAFEPRASGEQFGDWYVCCLESGEGYALSLAADGGKPRIRTFFGPPLAGFVERACALKASCI